MKVTIITEEKEQKTYNNVERVDIEIGFYVITTETKEREDIYIYSIKEILAIYIEKA